MQHFDFNAPFYYEGLQVVHVRVFEKFISYIFDIYFFREQTFFILASICYSPSPFPLSPNLQVVNKIVIK